MADSLSSFTSILHHTVPWTLVVFRVAGLFVLTPLLASTGTPMRFRAMLAMMLGAAAYPMLDVDVRAVPDDIFGVAAAVAGEAFIGLAIGAIGALPVLLLEMSGLVAGMTMGMGLARVYNPESDTETDVMGQLIFFIGMGIFLSLGGIDSLYAAVLASFERMPPGTISPAHAPLDALVAVLASGFELAFRVSLPVVGIVLLLIVVLGVLGKTIPAFNMMSVGFTFKLMGGIAMLAMGIYAAREPITVGVEDAINAAQRWVAGMEAPHG
ncbi:MAG TPA: flagellar biosynthetic protein FliR [Phycisphaerales bacterium]|nr:flagellar biosynthetic protein FliR [Phycisphaerales bacterium]